MPIKLKGATSGDVTLSAPAVAGTTSLILPTDSVQPGLVLVNSTAFSAVSAVNVNNCFTTTYENYRVVFETTTQSTTGNLSMRLRASGSDSATTYNNAGYYGGSLAGSINTTGGTTWGLFSPGTSGSGVFDFTFTAPFQSRATTVVGYAYDTRNIAFTFAFRHTTASAYDGFSVYSDAGTITGTVRVYGYRNSITT